MINDINVASKSYSINEFKCGNIKVTENSIELYIEIKVADCMESKIYVKRDEIANLIAMLQKVLPEQEVEPELVDTL